MATPIDDTLRAASIASKDFWSNGRLPPHPGADPSFMAQRQAAAQAAKAAAAPAMQQAASATASAAQAAQATSAAAPAAAAPAAEATAAGSKAGLLSRGAAAIKSGGAGLANAGATGLRMMGNAVFNPVTVGIAAGTYHRELGSGDLTPEVLAAYDDAKKNGYTGTQALSANAMVPNNARGPAPTASGATRNNLPTAGLPSAPAAAAAAPAQSPTPGQPQPRKLATNEFSDAAGLRDTAFWNRGPISAQNMQAADALDARYRAETAAALQQAQYARESGGRGPNVMVIPDTGGYGILDKEYQRQSNERSEMRQIMDKINDPYLGRSQRAALSELLKARMNIGQSERESVRGDSTSRRGQDLTYGATTRGQDMNYGATLRGQDMDLQGKVLPKQMELAYAARLRQFNADILRQAGGNRIEAAKLAQQYGFDGKNFLEAQSADDAITQGRVKAAQGSFEGQAFRVNEKGERVRDEQLEGDMYRRAQQNSNGGYAELSPPDQAAEMARARAEALMIQSGNDKRGTRLSNFFGTTKPAYSNMPTDKQLRGATLGTMGFWDDLSTSGKRDQGDRILRWTDDAGTTQEMYLDPETVDQATLRRWKDLGLKMEK